MKVNALKFLTMCFLLCFFAQTNVAFASTIQWARTNFPPFTILEGDTAGQGVVDRMIDFYIQKLPQYDQVKIEASLTRVLDTMERGLPVCHGSLLKKVEREAFADFLLPNMVQFSNGIVTSRKQLAQLRPHLVDDVTIDFLSLVRDNQLSIRYHANRSYSPFIDEIIQRHSDKPETSLAVKTGMKNTPKDIQLILKGRLSGVIGRPAEGYFASRMLEEGEELIFLSIAGQPKVQTAQIACAKGAWNRAFINDVNAVTLQYRKSNEFKQYYLEWLPENIRHEYPTLLDEAFPDS